MNPDREGRSVWSTVALAGIVALGAAVRFVRLGHQSFEYDEIVTLQHVHQSFGAMLSSFPHFSESTPPLYYVLIWPWSRIFGTSEAGMRSLSALAGTATVPVAYLVGRTMLRGRAGGLVVAALVSVAPVLVWYSQEARSYSLFVFLGALSLLYFARALDEPTPANLWLWALFSALAFATHYFAGFLVLAEALVLLTRLGRRAVPPIAAGLVVAAALAPLAYHQYRSGGNKWAWFLGNTIPGRLHEVLERFVYFNYNPGGTPLLAAAVAGAAALAFHGRRVGRAREALVVAGLTIGVPLVLAFVGIDLFEYRNMLVAWLPLAVAVAAGIVALPARALRAGCVALATLGLLGCTVMIARRVDLQRGSWRDGVAALQTESGRLVVMPTSVTMIAHYWPAVAELPARGARVSEVDVIGQGIAGEPSLGLKLPAFRLVRTLTAGNLTIYRLRAQTPQRVTGGELPWPAVVAGS
jgi:mannosyltransferase